MGFTKPTLPELDYRQWSTQPRMARLKPMVLHWATNGFGTPDAVYFLYILKLVAFLAGGTFVISLTPGLGSFGSVGSWWTEAVVYQKLVIWTLLWEVLGLGGGFGPLTLRFLPPVGGFLYWLRPGTIRLPPWPQRVPFTHGSRRSIVDAAMYAGVLGAAVWALLAPATKASGLPGELGLIAADRVLPLLILLPLLGLRDKTIFLAARSEVYLSVTAAFLLPGVDMIVAAKCVFLVIWVGAAVSKFTHQFAYVIQIMVSNNPILRSKWLKRKFYRDYPNDMAPSALATFVAHFSTAIELIVPIVLFCSGGGTVTTVAAIVMVIFHLNILLSAPAGVPLEWNVYMLLGIGILFVHYAPYNVGDLTAPLPVALLVAALVAGIVVGHLNPRKVSFLIGMRYYAGNWDTSMWCFTPSAMAKLESTITKPARLPGAQLATLYGDEVADLISQKSDVFRLMHVNGRALFGLIPRACGPDHETKYIPVDGDYLSGVILGWNFADGHLHNEQLVKAVQQRCHFEEGELRVIVLDAQPIHRQRQAYRLVDAATGRFESGYVTVADMRARQPWAGTIPTHCDPVRPLPSARWGHDVEIA
jgi:Transmembrane protein of unknown function (DUF3556)